MKRPDPIRRTQTQALPAESVFCVHQIDQAFFMFAPMHLSMWDVFTLSDRAGSVKPARYYSSRFSSTARAMASTAGKSTPATGQTIQDTAVLTRKVQTR